MFSGIKLAQRKATRNKSQLLHKSKDHTQVRRKVKPKPAWDNTVTDLSVYKPSPQEMQRNHEIHQPKKDHERLLKKFDVSKDFMRFEDPSLKYDSTPSGIANRKRAIIKEVFQNQEKELRNVLAETDKTLANVKDLFGDDVQKYRSIPTITKAPTYQEQMDDLLRAVDHESTLYYDTLSASIMKDSALNSLSSSDNDEDEVDTEENENENNHDNNKVIDDGINAMTSGYKPSIKLDRYETLFKDNNSLDSEQLSKIEVPDINSFSNILQEVGKKPSNNPDARGPSEKQKTNKGKSHHGKEADRTESTTYTFDDMKNMLDTLENEITQYEKDCGKEGASAKLKVPNSFTGYTASLLSVIIRITQHLKQSEVQLREEMAMRKEIIDAFEEQRTLVDELTSDLLETQEANEKLQQELDIQKKTLQTQYCQLKMEINELQNTINNLILTNGLKSMSMVNHRSFGHDENTNAVQKQNIHTSNQNNQLQDITNFVSNHQDNLNQVKQNI